MRRAFEEARATLGACLSLNGAARVDPDAVVAFLKNHPWCASAQVGEAVGTDTATLRPVMKRLIADGAVKARGKARGTRYAAG